MHEARVLDKFRWKICKRFKLTPDLLMHTIHAMYRYVKSRSDAQLRGDVASSSSLLGCQPVEYSDQLNGTGVITPCGLIAWSFFNDTYSVYYADLPCTVYPLIVSFSLDAT